ncbi:hypothetical protein [uncultured Brevibacillus sp.]|uniref:hypothetical protein n=1 Tax=uncultured Brevibacillus sp. TaxID=169970 RepID=UPI002599BD0D|nr:hypothetical protein [uncultured Brevibacillus sp.]
MGVVIRIAYGIFSHKDNEVDKFILFPVLLVLGCIGIVRSRSKTKQSHIEELEKRIEALEKETKRPKP